MEQRVHAVVLNYNQGDAALRAYAELRRSRGIEVDVLVVDCASAAAERDALRGRIPAERLLLLDQNLGYAGGMNAGIHFWLERAPEVAILLVTPDARLADDAAHGLWRELASHPNTGVVGPVVVYQDQPRRIGAGVQIDERGRVSRLSEIRAATTYEVGSLDGCCLLLRPEAIRAVGGFDEAYFLYFEETDLCHRLRAAGWQVCVVPDVFIGHPKSHSSAAPHVYYYMARNTYLFRTRHFGVSTWRAGLDLARSTLHLTGIALAASVLPQHWHQARDRWRNCALQWRGAWAGTRDHLKRRYGAQGRTAAA